MWQHCLDLSRRRCFLLFIIFIRAGRCDVTPYGHNEPFYTEERMKINASKVMETLKTTFFLLKSRPLV